MQTSLIASIFHSSFHVFTVYSNLHDSCIFIFFFLSFFYPASGMKISSFTCTFILEFQQYAVRKKKIRRWMLWIKYCAFSGTIRRFFFPHRISMVLLFVSFPIFGWLYIFNHILVRYIFCVNIFHLYIFYHLTRIRFLFYIFVSVRRGRCLISALIFSVSDDGIIRSLLDIDSII